MNTFTSKQWMVIIILSLLTALEPLSIDLYLPAFLMMADDFAVPASDIQLSLTTFLAGFAIGQLFWGPIADRFGRKRPILVSLLIFLLATLACLLARTVEQLWVFRFLQAIGGCGGVVISRAVVTDYFDKSKTLQIFTILAIIMGVAPIVAPIVGTVAVNLFNWKAAFYILLILASIMVVLTLFFLPETFTPQAAPRRTNAWRSYGELLKVRSFMVYSLLAGLANGALMIYVGNAPSLILEYGQQPPAVFSIVFAVNAFGLMIASYITALLQKYVKTQTLIAYAMGLLLLASAVLLILITMQAPIMLLFVLLFVLVFPIGVLFPATTELAMRPFSDNSGSASALFGSIQLFVAFLCMLVANQVHLF